MQLTRMEEYAVRAMIHLASVPDGTSVELSAISRDSKIPESFLRKIAARLSKAKLISSTRGVGGGVALAKSAHAINVLDVIEAMEGKLSLNKCLLCPKECGFSGWCDVHVLWREAQLKLKETLRSRSLAELADRSQRRMRRLSA
jgi:Rrf2 family protein